MKDRLVNGYKLVYAPDHPSSYKTGNHTGYIYEHVLEAERMMRRQLRNNEEVHHLDGYRLNNIPENLMVLEKSQHTKLHNWLRRHLIIPINQGEECAHKPLGNPEIVDRMLKSDTVTISEIQRPLNYCKVCNTPTVHKTFCSPQCNSLGRRKVTRPSPQILAEDLSTFSMTKVGEKYGVSDNAVRKWLKAYGMPVDRKEYTS